MMSKIGFKILRKKKKRRNVEDKKGYNDKMLIIAELV